MSYATLDDMVTRFSAETLLQLTQRDIDQPAYNADVVQAALDDATDIINAHAAGRYSVPLTPVPAPVRRWCADIARYYLHNGGQNGAVDPVRKAFEDAMKGLTDMQKGIVIFQAEGVSTPEKLTGGSVALAGPHRVFTAQSLRGF